MYENAYFIIFIYFFFGFDVSFLQIKLQDGRCFAGYIEDVDYESDLATVRVNAVRDII